MVPKVNCFILNIFIYKKKSVEYGSNCGSLGTVVHYVAMVRGVEVPQPLLVSLFH